MDTGGRGVKVNFNVHSQTWIFLSILMKLVFLKSILQQNVTFWFQNFSASKLLDLVSKIFGVEKVSD